MNLKNYKTFFLIVILFLLSSFREPNYCKMVDHITKSYLKEFALPRGLFLNGFGGAMMGDIQSVTLSFLSYNTLNVDEARVLYVEMMEEFLRRINSHEKVRPHLHNFPFDDSNIKLTIGFEDSKRKITSDGHVALMSIAKDHILYFAAYDPDKGGFYDLCEEPYAEASRIAMGQSHKVNFLTPLTTHPLKAHSSLEDTYPKEEDTYKKEVARKGYDFQKKYFNE